MTTFTFTITAEPAATVVNLTGGLDLHTAPELRPALIRAVEGLRQGGQLVIDLAELDFIDSSGLSVFIAAHKRGVAHGARVRLVHAPEFLVRLLTVTGLDAIFLASSDAP